MDHLSVADVAKELGLPVESVRSYGERFVLFVPAVRVGEELRYPPEAVRLLGEIDQAVAAGATFDEIEIALREHIPVAVVSAGESATSAGPPLPSFDVLLDRVDGLNAALTRQIEELKSAMGRLTTADEFHTLRAETASLAALLAQRDAQVLHAMAVVAAELREAVVALRQDHAEIHDEVREERRQLAELAASILSAPDRSGSAPDRRGDRPISRTPRRMGQPLRLNGLPQN